MSGRLIAIGDMHGCAAALAALLEAVRPQPDDRLITLGDYIDRGPDSRGVIDQLIALSGRCELIPLLGNHDKILLRLLQGARRLLRFWMDQGGRATLDSFGCREAEAIPRRYIDFLEGCRARYESPHHIFMHANYLAHLPLKQQSFYRLRWESLRLRHPGPHCSGKTAIVGHTSQRSHEVLDLGYLVCIDTRCYGGGWLTARAPETGTIWQTNQQGQLRSF